MFMEWVVHAAEFGLTYTQPQDKEVPRMGYTQTASRYVNTPCGSLESQMVANNTLYTRQ